MLTNEYPTLTAFLAGEPAAYDAGGFGWVHATFKKTSDVGLPHLVISRNGRVLKDVIMGENQVIGFYENLP